MHDDIDHGTSESSGGFPALIVSMVLLGIFLAGYLGYQGIRGLLVDLREKYTDTTPLELPGVTLSDEASAPVIDRVDQFASCMRSNSPADALILTADDINILINNHPAWKDVAGKLYVEIDQDKLLGTISAPLDPVSHFLSGRYFNGNAVFRVSLENDQLQVYIDTVEIGGEKLAGKLMKSIQGKNLAEDADLDADSRDFFRKLDSIKIQDDKLIIIPKSVHN